MLLAAEITTPSGKKQYPKIVDNGDGTVKVRYQPSEVGLHLLTVKYNNEEVSGTLSNYSQKHQFNNSQT